MAPGQPIQCRHAFLTLVAAVFWLAAAPTATAKARANFAFTFTSDRMTGAVLGESLVGSEHARIKQRFYTELPFAGV